MNMLSNHIPTIPLGARIKGKWNGNVYKIERTLGSGENGRVYLVEGNNRSFALKMSLASTDLSYEIQAIQRMSEAQGPALGFSVFDIDDFQYKGRFFTFYVMPYQRGIPIKNYLYGKRSKDYLEIFKKVIYKLEELHRQGWVVGDIKPEHILIDTLDNNNVSLIDFGGVTKENEGVRQYTELFDRGAWKAGSRKADPHYDFFSVAMVFISIGMGRSKFMKIFNHSRSLNYLYDIIRRIHYLQLLAPVLKGIINGDLNDSKSILESINVQENKIDESKIDYDINKWINWTLTSSIVFFLITFIYFIT